MSLVTLLTAPLALRHTCKDKSLVLAVLQPRAPHHRQQQELPSASVMELLEPFAVQQLKPIMAQQRSYAPDEWSRVHPHA